MPSRAVSAVSCGDAFEFAVDGVAVSGGNERAEQGYLSATPAAIRQWAKRLHRAATCLQGTAGPEVAEERCLQASHVRFVQDLAGDGSAA